MKATTTVTTSSYYGAHTSSTKANPQMVSATFISPQQMIKRLIPYADVQKNKQNVRPQIQQPLINSHSKNLIISDIQNFQSELNNIHAQIIESQNMLNVRDSLYGQLDMLKEEREQIEGDIAYFQTESTKQVRVNVRANHGYKEMNERLRRRMNEIREYIHKMELQNRKIEENINFSNALSLQKNYRTQVNSTAWVDNAYFSQKQRTVGRVDDLITRLHMKQEQALDKVRRQEEDIDRRNQINRASFVNTSNNVMTSQMAGRSYHGPSTGASYGGRRLYSPQYRF